MFRPYLDLTEVRIDEENSPVRIYYDQIKTIIKSRRDPSGTYISLTSEEGVHVSESYQHVKEALDGIRETPPPRLSYVFRQKVGRLEYSHYVPSDEVSRVMVNKENNHVSLFLKSGDKVDTGMVMNDLKNTLIEVHF